MPWTLTLIISDSWRPLPKCHCLRGWLFARGGFGGVAVFILKLGPKCSLLPEFAKAQVRPGWIVSSFVGLYKRVSVNSQDHLQKNHLEDVLKCMFPGIRLKDSDFTDPEWASGICIFKYLPDPPECRWTTPWETWRERRDLSFSGVRRDLGTRTCECPYPILWLGRFLGKSTHKETGIIIQL